MPRSAILRVSTLTLIGVLAAIAHAGGQVPIRLTLDEAVARAADASHRLAELKAREAGSLAVVDARDAADRPLVSAQAGYVRTNHVDEFGFVQPGRGLVVLYPDVPDNWRARLDLLWPIYSGGRTDALARAAKAEALAAGKDRQAAAHDLKLEVTRAFWAVVTATESVRVVEQAQRRVEAQLAQVRARYDAGLAPSSDVTTIEAQRSRQEGLLLEARNLREVARADLARLVGLPVESPVEVEAALAEPAPTALPADALTDARAARPDRSALVSRVTAADERVEAARAGARPQVGVAGGVDYARPNPRILPRADEWNPSWDVGVSLSWSLWNGGRTAADVAEARHLAEASRQRLAEFDSLLAFELRQRQLDLDTARAHVRTAGDAVRSAAEARRVLEERFRVGVALNTDLLDAQVLELQAELDRTRAQAGVRMALARLERTLGK